MPGNLSMENQIIATFIGSGNLAYHLAPAMENIGVKVGEVYGRNQKTVDELVSRLYEAERVHSLDFSGSESNLFVLAVSDKSIEEIASEIILPEEAVVIHCSGSQPLSILGYVPTDNIGVLYPVQSFSPDAKIDFPEIPLCIESQNEFTHEFLLSMAKKLSGYVVNVESADRKAIHVAAVFANNFVNHLIKISKDIIENKGIDFDILHPLIKMTVEKSMKNGPELSQTGPAIRNDREITDNHLTYLSHNETLVKIYESISESITNTYLNKLEE